MEQFSHHSLRRHHLDAALRQAYVRSNHEEPPEIAAYSRIEGSTRSFQNLIEPGNETNQDGARKVETVTESPSSF